MSFEHYPNLIDRALYFAAQAHDGQFRKAGRTPYIAHPVGVAMILQRYQCPTAVIAAALLHDTIEDTTATLEQINSAFGPEVAMIVAACTEPNGPWELRKRSTIARVETAPLPVKLVVTADKYHNLSQIARNLKMDGEQVWDRFSRPKPLQAWYYRSMSHNLSANLPPEAPRQLFSELAQLVQTVFEGIPSQAPTE